MYAPVHPADRIAQRVAPARRCVESALPGCRAVKAIGNRRDHVRTRKSSEFLDRKISVSDERTTGSHGVSAIYLTRIPPSRRSRARSCCVRMHARIYAQRYARLVKPQLVPQHETMISHNEKKLSKESMYSRKFIEIAYYKLCIVGYIIDRHDTNNS